MLKPKQREREKKNHDLTIRPSIELKRRLKAPISERTEKKRKHRQGKCVEAQKRKRMEVEKEMDAKCARTFGNK